MKTQNIKQNSSANVADGDRYDRYDSWAWLYNRTMGPVYGKEQLEMIERMLLPRLPQQANILDLCCGTGQLIQPLIEQGYQVTGLDGSEEMLACARENASDATFIMADARQYQAPENFDAVFSTSASLNHIGSIDELKQVFTNVYASLRPQGTFVFDLNHPGQLTKWWRGTPTEGHISKDCAWMVTPRYNTKEQLGAFCVTMYQRPKNQTFFSKISTVCKSYAYQLLSPPRFIGLRLRLLSNFGSYEPSWERSDLDFPVIGHDLDAVKSALEEVGFPRIEIITIDGQTTIDDDHSAHFICSKAAG